MTGVTSNGTDTDIWVRKYDSTGAELWTRTFDSGGQEQGNAIAADNEDNVLVAGSTGSGADVDIWIRKYTP